MKLKIVLLGVMGVLAIGGVADAAGMFGRTTGPERALLQRAQALTRAARHPGATASRARRGPRGPRGFQGAQGPRGTFGTITTVTGPATSLCAYPASGGCEVGGSTAVCPAGTVPVSGGWVGLGINAVVSYSAKSGNGWSVIAVNWDGSSVNFNATAECAS